jgi:hypothetical protein
MEENKMNRKVIAIATITAAILVINICPVFADTQESAQESSSGYSYQIEYEQFDDGSYCETIIETESIAISSGISAMTASSTSTTAGTKTLNYKNSSGVLQWYVKVSGSFTYNGSTSTCTSSAVTAAAPSNNWKISSKSASKNGNTAKGAATAKLYMESLVAQTVSKTVILTCSKTGAFS